MAKQLCTTSSNHNRQGTRKIHHIGKRRDAAVEIKDGKPGEPKRELIGEPSVETPRCASTISRWSTYFSPTHPRNCRMCIHSARSLHRKRRTPFPLTSRCCGLLVRLPRPANDTPAQHPASRLQRESNTSLRLPAAISGKLAAAPQFARALQALAVAHLACPVPDPHPGAQKYREGPAKGGEGYEEQQREPPPERPGREQERQ